MREESIFIFLVVCSSLLNHVYAQVFMVDADVSILRAFKFSNVYGNRNKLTKWESAYDCNKGGWTGVSCNEDGHVIILDFTGLQLKANLSDSLGGLVYLEKIILTGNNFTGPLPSGLGNLYYLTELIAPKNSFTGDIPIAFQNLYNLQKLDLSGNLLDGKILSDFSQTPNLIKVDLKKNKLRGTIPSKIGVAVNLTYLDLSQNVLWGSVPRINGPKLKFDVSQNYLNGRINNITINGSAFCSSSFKKLNINIDLNCLQFPSLSLPCFSSQRVNSDCTNYCDASQSLGYCGGHGKCLPILKSKAKVCSCDKGYTNYTKSTTCVDADSEKPPPTFKVKLVKFQENALLEFKALVTSDPYNVISTWVQGRTCEKWQGLSCDKYGNVQKIDLYGASLAGTIPSNFDSFYLLQYLDLSNNALRGSIPFSLGSITTLTYVDLSNNQLTGEIPSIFSSNSLVYLNVENNFLSGSPAVVRGNNIFCPAKIEGISGYFIKGNCLTFDQKSKSCFARQRQLYECLSFCNANQTSGACGGHGRCVQDPVKKTSVCQCDEGYGNFVDKYTCTFTLPTYTGFTALSSRPQTKYLNPYFRHSSAYYGYSQSGKATWVVALEVNWASEFSSWNVSDQQYCSSCWAVAPMSAIEGGYAIVTANQKPPSLSSQQVMDCFGEGNGCGGGWPGNALEYAATKGLQNSQIYPYLGRNRTSCPTFQTQGLTISHYEEVNFNGWFGLLLAVQQQPVIVNIQASSPEFANYAGGIFNSEDCFTDGVDHTVVLVGYNIGNFPPYWIIRNSWGPKWGEKGYMRLQITGGSGVCGINTLPGLYPVFKKAKDPCNKVNFGQTLNKYFQGGPGTVNPCGRFNCTVKGTTNVCDCKMPFIPVTNIDGSQSCALYNPCSFFPTNPCGVGSCLNSANGTYSCVCPIGYSRGQLTINGKPTCVPTSVATGPQYFKVPDGTSVSCQLVFNLYGIRKDRFIKQNPAVNCNKPIASGTVLNVTSSSQGCSLPYALNRGDSCVSVARLFKLRALAGRNTPNPDLDCTKLEGGQQVCIKVGSPPDVPLCTFSYSLQYNEQGKPTENCTSIINEKFGGDAAAFFSLNPGLYCDRLTVPTDPIGAPISQVCLQAENLGTIKKGCVARKVFTVSPGQTCAYILRRYFGSKMSLFRKANRNTPCVDSRLFAGMILCKP